MEDFPQDTGQTLHLGSPQISKLDSSETKEVPSIFQPIYLLSVVDILKTLSFTHSLGFKHLKFLGLCMSKGEQRNSPEAITEQA